MSDDELLSDEELNRRLRLRNRPALGDFLQLMRLPNVFTALADVAMGFLFVQSSWTWKWNTPRDAPTLAMLLVASALLYAAGMVLNDVFDADLDSRERPERPIPSGRVSLAMAGKFGWSLLFAGVAVGSASVFFTGHLRPGVVAALLAIAIVAYDAWLKRTPLGPLAMGACRTLNVLLGMNAVDATLHAEHWLVAGAIGVYVAGVTWFAKQENEQSSRGRLTFGLLVMLLGVAMLGWLPQCSNRLLPQPSQWYLLTGALGLLIGWRCLWAVMTPTPRNVRRAVANGIVSLVMLDAVACYSVRGVYCASMILLLLFPALFFGRKIEMT